MSELERKFVGSIPKIYQEFMVPLIFEGYAADMAARVAKRAPRDTLETAAGTGVVTRQLAAKLAPEARLTVTDLNGAMLEEAQRQVGSERKIDWQQADALALPFADASFDAVVCQFGAMFFPDRVKGYRESRRVLREGGTFFFYTWGRVSENPMTELVEQELAAIYPDDPPRFMSQTPHGYYDLARIRSDVEAAGFRDPAIETVNLVSRAPSAKFVATALCQGTPLRNIFDSRGSDITQLTNRVEEALKRRYGTGALEDKIQAIVIEARR